MKVIQLILFLLLASCTYAQIGGIGKTQIDSLWLKRPFIRYYPVVMNQQIRLHRGQAEALLTKVPDALKEYKKYRNRSKISLYSYAAFFVGTTVAVLGFDNTTKSVTAVGLTVSIYSFVNAIVFHTLADGSLRKAIKAYNQSSVRY